MRFPFLPIALLLAPLTAAGASDWVHPGPDGRLAYLTDGPGNRVMDFSNVGYHQGASPIPVLSTGAAIEPISGDATSKIQAAIDKVSKNYPNPKGFRGAVVLSKGTYRISGTLYFRTGGVVLRGEGDGPDGTTLLATGSKQRSLIVVGPVEPPPRKTTAKPLPAPADIVITDSSVPVGARSFTVSGTQGLRIGARILVVRPSTEAWQRAIGAEPPKPDGKTAPMKALVFSRTITAIDDARVTIDAPLAVALDARYGGGVVQVPGPDAAISEVGIENLRGDSEFKGPEDEKHGWVLVEFVQAKDAWVRQVSAVHFGEGLVLVGPGSRQITVEHCACLDPVSPIAEGHRDGFCVAGELTLVQHCYSRDAEHAFAVLPQAAGPNVFFDCVGEQGHGPSGPQGRWSVGVLYDNVRMSGGGRGELSTRDLGANQVLWNCKADRMVVQSPPTAQNWAIGCDSREASGDGIWDVKGSPVFPRSLYLSQLSERLAAATPTGPSVNQ